MMGTATLRQHLTTLVNGHQWEELLAYLSALRTTDHRTASTILAEASTWVGVSENHFWDAFAHLCSAKAKAYMGTLLKAVKNFPTQQALTFESQALETYCRHRATEIDLSKMREMLLPLARSPQVLQHLVSLLALDTQPDHVQAYQYFMAATPTAYYAFFLTLRRLDDKPALLRRYAVELIRRGDARAFQLANLLRVYFDLDPLPGTFSLDLPPYQLSRLEQDYEAFCALLS